MNSLQEQNETLVKDLFSLINKMGNEEDLTKALKEEVLRQHRTLQQSFFRLAKEVVCAYAEHAEKYGSDLRNEASVRWAQDVAKIKDSYMPFI